MILKSTGTDKKMCKYILSKTAGSLKLIGNCKSLFKFVYFLSFNHSRLNYQVKRLKNILICIFL